MKSRRRTRAERANRERAADRRVIRRAERECGVRLVSTAVERNEPTVRVWLARVSFRFKPQMEAAAREALEAAVLDCGSLFVAPSAPAQQPENAATAPAPPSTT